MGRISSSFSLDDELGLSLELSLLRLETGFAGDDMVAETTSVALVG